MKDIPFFNGFYTKVGGELLISYPGYPYVKAHINYGGDIYALAGLDEYSSATVTLHKKANI